MPCLTTWAHSCSAVVLPMWTMLSPKGVQKQSHGWSCQGCKAANHTGTLLNLPQHWNSPELSGTCLRNLYQHTGTLRNLPEPDSGTCSCDPHRHTPELIWAEDPISLRCWGKIFKKMEENKNIKIKEMKCKAVFIYLFLNCMRFLDN